MASPLNFSATTAPSSVKSPIGTRHPRQAALLENLINACKDFRPPVCAMLRAPDLSTLAGAINLCGEPLAAVGEINHDVVDVMVVLGRVSYDANIR